ncbi:alpha/beta hydrolase [Mucilaginibacter arboris]|uniref:Prolyl oligopeptidase family serine peptidase n=1 Tax=Mucilaginibacter arboris TaxID=2682090 RepID=A0A7K1SY08_9SPHI|nr:alpha/beta hydrolase family protein [Mucilaginibacter arboris]MVN22202.1 prolyl oligopeptidase family serine peptidase [Mucilaginibacter arboris]
MLIKRVCFVLASLFLNSFLFAQEMLVIQSENLKTSDTIWVYKPEAYTNKQKYPLVYLLHGHGGDYTSWSKLTDLQKLADEYQFLIVCPDGLKKSWYINSPHQDSTQYEDFFMKELLPAISKKYAEDPSKVFITGNSMGGYGAMWLFLKHPDVFLSAGSTSGVLNLRYSSLKKTTVAYLLGDYSDDNTLFDEYSPINLLKNIAGASKAIIFDCGTEDYLYVTAKAFREKCDELKIKATYTAQPGAHTGSYWSKSILQHFRFFAEQVTQITDAKATKLK